jgi:pimeloyl-ACP methyl ester carboxylesterase
MLLRLLPVLLPFVSLSFGVTDVRAQTAASISNGDWVGELRLRDSSTFIHVRFDETASPARGVADLPMKNHWNVRLGDLRIAGSAVSFTMPLSSDTARFDGFVSDDVINGDLRSVAGVGRLHLIRRMAYDSALVRPLAGNYRISPGRVISMGPMDEADGWLSFFDSKTRRGGILYAMSDSVLFTGPSFGVDYPIAIRATIRRSAEGEINGLGWEEIGRRPLEARRLADYRQEDVAFNNGNVRLAGNLTLPRKPGTHPAVILIHGAGGTIPTRDFGYWSTYFAGHGIAVLAFDKRGGGASTGDANTGTYEDLADDVLAGLTMLQKRGDIDPRCIGLYGMSNGGYIAPLAAERSNGRVAFIAVRSGSAQQVGSNISFEVGNDLRSEGFTDSDVEKAVEIRRSVTDFVISHPKISTESWDSLKKEVAAVSSERWFPWSRVLWVPRVNPADGLAIAFLDKLRLEWEYDPIPHWKKVRAPVYVMLGELDRSVPSAKSARMLRGVLPNTGAKATVRVFKSGNHGLLVAQTGYDRETKSLGYYVPGFQDGLVAWIGQHIPCKAQIR